MSVRIGVVNWDCSLPSDTYFGYHQTRSLSPAKYRPVTPYYADILGENKIDYHTRTQVEYDRELSYAIDAGIDYFAYVWYPHEGSKSHVTQSENDCSAHVFELNYARKMHQSSALRDKIGLCAIAGAHPFADSDIRELALAMQEPYYEKNDGRPLVYTFGGARQDFVLRLRKICAEVGTPDPYAVGMFASRIPENTDLSACDAVSAYACCLSGITDFADLAAKCISNNEGRRLAGKPVVPQFTTGWDPSPRLDSPSPWCKYAYESYHGFASEKELLDEANALTDWIKASCAEQYIGHILSFAWNEFEEGGIICPTVGADGSPDTAHLTAFGKCADHFRKLL